MRRYSVIGEAKEIELATDLIRLGARLQMVETETKLSRERLLRLYKEIWNKIPPKGLLPFSTDWFLSWQPNLHASLFANIYQYLIEHNAIERIDALVRAYRLYLEHVEASKLEQVLSLTRAWILVRYFDSGMLCTTGCEECGGQFVVHCQDLHRQYLCGLCNVPARAGKTNARRRKATREDEALRQ